MARKMWPAEHLTRENRWGYWHPYLPFLGDEVTGKTVAVIGTGRIGLAMIKKCAGLRHEYAVLRPGVRESRLHSGHPGSQGPALSDAASAARRAWIRYTTLNDALSNADYISLHVPLLREGESTTPTYHLINEKTLRMMKPTAMLINTSRGPVVDEKALAHALKENWIAGAALDVYEKEPLPADSPLARSCDCRPLPPAAALCQRRSHHTVVARSRQRHGRTLRARSARRAGRELRRRYYEDAVCGEQRSVREVAGRAGSCSQPSRQFDYHE